MSVKVKFVPAVIHYYYWITEMAETEEWILGKSDIPTRVQGNLADYKKYCISMLAVFMDNDIPALVNELGDVKFQWTYYVTMPREEAFRLQLKYGEFIDTIR